MSKIELLNKKIIENLKFVSPTGGFLDSYVNNGAKPPNHMGVDRKLIQELKEEKAIDENTDKKDLDQ